MNTVMTIALTLALVALLPSSPARAAEEKVELKLRFEEGQRLTLTTTAEQKTTRSGGPRAPEWQTTDSMTTALALKVLSVDDDGTATIEVTIKSIARKHGGWGWKYECDSENPPNHVPSDAAPYAAIVGKAFTMRLTPTGHVTELEGHQPILRAINNAFRRPLRSAEAQQLIIVEAKRRFGEVGLTRTMEGAFGFLPDEPVAVGDSWTRTMTIDYGIPVIAEETYTLTERSDGTGTITREAALKPLEYDALRHHPVKYEVSGTQAGTVSLDDDAGCLLKATIRQKLEGKRILWKGIRRERSVDISVEAAITIELQQEPEDAEETPEAE